MAAPLKVLILHMRYHPDPTGTGLIVTQLAEALARYGARVRVITGHPHYAQTRAAARTRIPLLDRLTRNGVEIWRTYTYVPPSPAIFHRALGYLSYTFLSTFAALAAGQPDVILWMTPPITTGLTAWLAALFHPAPVVFDLQDIWPDQVVRVGKLKNRWIIRGAEILERFLYRQAAGIRVLSEDMREALRAKGVPDGKMVTLPNWVDPDEIVPGERENGFRAAQNLDGAFVLLFSGNIGYVAGLETVLEAAQRVADLPEVQFLIVGEGNARADLLAYAARLGAGNVRFLPTQPRAELPRMLAAADVCLAPLRQGLSGISVPSKTYTAMASGRPVLAVAERGSDLSRLVAASGCGVCVPPADPGALAEAVRWLRREPERRAQMGANARQYVVEHYAQARLTRRYYEWLKTLVPGHWNCGD